MNAARPSPQPGFAVRDARSEDLSHVQRIYAHHVRHGLASFEETPPDLAEIARRHEAVVRLGLPYLVAEAGGSSAHAGTLATDAGRNLLGYAYAAPYRPRPAYRFTLEDSIYVDEAAAGKGVGRALLAELIRRCEGLGYRQMLAVIGDSGNAGSIGLHGALGFKRAGLFKAVGFKFGRWVDSVVMQRALGPGEETLPAAPSTRTE
jgi:phosphinothricin acetyltransferase